MENISHLAYVLGLGDGEEPPRAVDALQVVFATVVEGGGTAKHHVAYGGRRPELAIGRGLFDSRREVHGNAGDVEVVANFDLPGMHRRITTCRVATGRPLGQSEFSSDSNAAATARSSTTSSCATEYQ